MRDQNIELLLDKEGLHKQLNDVGAIYRLRPEAVLMLNGVCLALLPVKHDAVRLGDEAVPL